MAGKFFVVDLSEFQSGISFSRLKSEGVQGVILRGGDGPYLDPCFLKFYDEAKAQGLPVGAYWFSRALTAAAAKEEAERFYTRCLAGRRFALPIYLDCEADSQRALGKRALTDVIKSWSGALREKGCLCGVYSTAEWFRSYMLWDELQHLERWVAQWSTQAPTISHGMWQFGGETNYLRDKHIAGYIVDQNYMVKDYPAIVKQNGYNGYKEEIKMYKHLKDIPAWARETIDELIADGALRGKEGEGEDMILDLSESDVRLLVIFMREIKGKTAGSGADTSTVIAEIIRRLGGNIDTP